MVSSKQDTLLRKIKKKYIKNIKKYAYQILSSIYGNDSHDGHETGIVLIKIHFLLPKRPVRLSRVCQRSVTSYHEL